MPRRKNPKRKVKRKVKRKGVPRGLKIYSYKRMGDALGETGKVNLGNLTAHTFNGTWINPAYEIANNNDLSVVNAFKYLQEHKLNQMIGLNDFITFNEAPATGTVRQLYGQFKITGIQIKLIPNLNSLDQTQGVNRPTQIMVQTVRDDANLLDATSTEGRVKQFQAQSNRKLIWNGKSTLSYYFRPKHSTSLGFAGQEYGVAQKNTGGWIRMDQAGCDLAHHGDKLFFKSTATFDTQLTNNFRIEKTFYVKFRQVM
jgi:hypothetical protein